MSVHQELINLINTSIIVDRVNRFNSIHNDINNLNTHNLNQDNHNNIQDNNISILEQNINAIDLTTKVDKTGDTMSGELVVNNNVKADNLFINNHEIKATNGIISQTDNLSLMSAEYSFTTVGNQTENFSAFSPDPNFKFLTIDIYYHEPNQYLEKIIPLVHYNQNNNNEHVRLIVDSDEKGFVFSRVQGNSNKSFLIKTLLTRI